MSQSPSSMYRLNISALITTEAHHSDCSDNPQAESLRRLKLVSSALLQSATTTAWRKYHEATKHSSASLRRNKHFLDWANMPDPFRHYEGVPVIDLPADPPQPDIPALAVLAGHKGTDESAEWDAVFSRLLYYSGSISAAKQAPSGDRYALRVNPSSGKLDPTSFPF